MISNEIQQYVQQQIALAQKNALYSTKNASSHTHNGIDSPKIFSNISFSSMGGFSYNPTYTAINSTTPTALQFQNNLFSSGVTWDAINNQFVVQTAGVYTVGCVITISGNTGLAGSSVYSYVYQNGASVIQGVGACPVDSGNTGNIVGIGSVQCAIGDTISFYGGARFANMTDTYPIITTQQETYGFIQG